MNCFLNTWLQMKSFPELKCYRDIIFYWKYFLNTDRKTFPNYVNPVSPGDVPLLCRPTGELNFQWIQEYNSYQVKCGWNDSMHWWVSCKTDFSLFQYVLLLCLATNTVSVPIMPTHSFLVVTRASNCCCVCHAHPACIHICITTHHHVIYQRWGCTYI